MAAGGGGWGCGFGASKILQPLNLNPQPLLRRKASILVYVVAIALEPKP